MTAEKIKRGAYDRSINGLYSDKSKKICHLIHGECYLPEPQPYSILCPSHLFGRPIRQFFLDTRELLSQTNVPVVVPAILQLPYPLILL